MVKLNFANIDKIKFKEIGFYYEPKKVFGKITNSFRCPKCRNELKVYKRKGLIKIECPNCFFSNVKKSFIDIGEEHVFKQFRLFQEMLEK